MSKSVLIIVENLPVPFDGRVWKEALALHRHGYQVVVLCPRGKGYEEGHVTIDGIHIYRHPACTEGDGHLAYLREFISALFWEMLYTWWIYFRHGFHVIQGCNPPDDIFIIALPFKPFGVKYIFDHHDATPELYLSKYGRTNVAHKILMWLERLTYRFSDVVMATNNSYKQLAVSRGGMDPEDVFVVRNGPDLAAFKAVPHNESLKYGKQCLVGYVGTMSIQDGLDILVEVAHHIKTLGRNDIHFTCVGGGPGLPALQKMVQERQLGDMVNFTGRIPDQQLLEILSTADICVNPDRPCEMNDISTMIKIMEYMALSKPIVQFECKEGRVSADGASLYADPKVGVPDFAAKVLWLSENPNERKRMGELGRKRVEAELSWEHSIENLLAAYDRALTGRAHALSQADRSLEGFRSGVEKKQVPTTETSNVGQAFVDYFRCPERYAKFSLAAGLSPNSGFFQVGHNAICYGQSSTGHRASRPTDVLYDALQDIHVGDSSIQLPFDPTQLVENLRRERYQKSLKEQTRSFADHSLVRRTYYWLRPLLGVSLRKHLQRIYLNRKRHFPAWPLERAVDSTFETLMSISLRLNSIDRIPFIWFWPEGFQSCLIMTHDVETTLGRDSCSKLMDVDSSFGIRSSFGIIPEQRYSVSPSFLDSFRARGFEITIHDLNHDGRLLTEHKEFVRRATRINQYGKKFCASGFRAGSMYREPDWFDALEFSYDMSIPNSAHLDPQPGGCCTLMPYFIGNLLELPATTTQDYALFHILDDYSLSLWESQIASITAHNGLISFIVHPDYIQERKARDIYIALLRHLSDLIAGGTIWHPLPQEVDQWWRQRSQMTLVQEGDSWRIEGPGNDRARLAYASFVDGAVQYSVVRGREVTVL